MDKDTKVLAVFSSFPIPPRLKKIAALFGDNIQYVSWNRKNDPELNHHINTNEAIFTSKDAKFFNILRFRHFLKAIIRKEKPAFIICRHWHTYFIAKTIIGKYKIIYDVCDVPISRYIRSIEKKLISHNDVVVLASRFFRKFYNKCNTILLENRVNYQNKLEKSNSDKLRITFLGVIRYKDILKNLIDLCKEMKDIELTFYGYGPDLEALQAYANEKKASVQFKGAYTQSDLPSIYSVSDVIWAAYPSKNENVKLAISNKYFETLAFETPGIFASNTMLGELIEEKKIGYVVNPYSIEDIASLINRIKKEKPFLDMIERMKQSGELKYWDQYLEDIQSFKQKIVK